MEIKGKKSAKIARFFANKPNEPHKLNLGGKRLGLANFPEFFKNKIMERLADKDPVMAKSLKEGKFGIKIDGVEVSKHNIKDFEVGAMKDVKKVKAEKVVKKESKKKLSEKQLFALTKSEQSEMLKALGEKKIPRFEKSRVKKLLELQ